MVRAGSVGSVGRRPAAAAGGASAQEGSGGQAADELSSDGMSSCVYTGLKKELKIGRELPTGTRVTVRMPTASSANKRLASVVPPRQPREQAGLYPRPLTQYDREAREKNWMPRFPRKQTRAWVTGGNNVLRRSNLPQRSLEHLWPELELVVDVNPKFTLTGMHSDYLLPAAGYYEKRGIKYAVAYIPYLHYCDAAVPPIGESNG